MTTIASGRSLGFAKCGNCLVYLSSTSAPGESDWAEYMEWLTAALDEKGRGKLEILVYERGPGPNAAQRKQLRTLVEERDVKVAVVTTSPVARGVMTALSWFAKSAVYRAFAPAELESAFEFLELDHRAKTAVRQVIDDVAFFG